MRNSAWKTEAQVVRRRRGAGTPVGLGGRSTAQDATSGPLRRRSKATTIPPIGGRDRLMAGMGTEGRNGNIPQLRRTGRNHVHRHTDTTDGVASTHLGTVDAAPHHRRSPFTGSSTWSTAGSRSTPIRDRPVMRPGRTSHPVSRSPSKSTAGRAARSPSTTSCRNNRDPGRRSPRRSASAARTITNRRRRQRATLFLRPGPGHAEAGHGRHHRTMSCRPLPHAMTWSMASGYRTRRWHGKKKT